MKTLSKLLLLFTLLSLISCNEPMVKTPLINIKGGIIYDKRYIDREHIYYDIYYNNKIIKVKVFPIDSSYKIGDTIR